MDLAELHDAIVPVKSEPALDDAGRLLFQAAGLAGEAGEVANEAKKAARDDMLVLDDGDRTAAIVEECGDVLFYMSRLLRLRGRSLDDAAHALLAKLDAIAKSRERPA